MKKKYIKFILMFLVLMLLFYQVIFNSKIVDTKQKDAEHQLKFLADMLIVYLRENDVDAVNISSLDMFFVNKKYFKNDKARYDRWGNKINILNYCSKSNYILIVSNGSNGINETGRGDDVSRKIQCVKS